MKSRSLFLLIVFCLQSALADTKIETINLGACSLNDEQFGIFSETPLAAGSTRQRVTIISSKKSPTKRNLVTSAELNFVKQQIELPMVWRPQLIPFSACKFNSPLRPEFELFDIPMQLQGYAVLGDPSNYGPNIDIDQLVKQGQAFPVVLDIICRSTMMASDPLGCEEIYLLQKEFPVYPVPTRTPGRLESNSLVQIKSGYCSDSKTTTGSGVVINWLGKKLILTSAYNVLKSGNGICTQVNKDQVIFGASTIRHSWGTGLAVLEITSGDFSQVPAVNIDQSATYPFKVGLSYFNTKTNAAEQEITSLLSAKSDRHYIPSIATVLEVKSNKAFDSSVQGSGVFLNSNLIGLVSHQHLKANPGSATRPLHWSNELGDHFVVIKSSDIVAWMNSSVANDDTLSLPAEYSFSAMPTLVSGSLKFTENCPPFDSSALDDNYPIGGGDAYGIGGDGNSLRACKVEVSLAKNPSTGFFNPSLSYLRDQMLAHIKNGFALTISYAHYRDTSSRLQKNYFYSLESFFKNLLSSQQTEILYTLWNPITNTYGADSSINKFRQAADDCSQSSKKFYGRFKSSDPTTGELIRRIYFISELAKSEQWKNLTANDFEELLDPNGTYAWSWNSIEQFGAGGKQLKQLLQNLRTEWQNIK